MCEKHECGKQNVEKGLKLLQDAARESREFITQNPHEISFQMHSRLADAADKC